MRATSRFVCEASPSLALLKYWGKTAIRRLPATPSLAINLAALKTTTEVEASFEGEDAVIVDGSLRPGERYAAFFAALRRELGAALRFRATSRNDFPGGAGLASSSSGFAALALAAARAGEQLLGRSEIPERLLSALARAGSASAARAVIGGFSLLPAGARYARRLFDEEHWPELRVIVALVSSEAKPISSREAMERCRVTSAFYRSWLRSAAKEVPQAIEAVARRDLEGLGVSMRRSYSRMFGTMLSADPPLLYWLPGSVALLRECEALRRDGIGAWETMDAGPQVKVICLASDAPRISARLLACGGALKVIESSVGGAPLLRQASG